MAVENQYFELFAGVKKDLRVTVIDQDSEDTPQPVKDMAGKRIIFTLGTFDSDGNAVHTSNALKKDSDVVGDVDATEAGDGIVVIKIVSSDTASLSGDYHFQVEAIDTDDEPVMLASGTLRIKGNTSNA